MSAFSGRVCTETRPPAITAREGSGRAAGCSLVGVVLAGVRAFAAGAFPAAAFSGDGEGAEDSGGVTAADGGAVPIAVGGAGSTSNSAFGAGLPVPDGRLTCHAMPAPKATTA